MGVNRDTIMSDPFDPFAEPEQDEFAVFAATATTANNDSSFGSSGAFSNTQSHGSGSATSGHESPAATSRNRSVSRSPSSSRHATSHSRSSRSQSRSPSSRRRSLSRGAAGDRTSSKPSRKGKRPSKSGQRQTSSGNKSSSKKKSLESKSSHKRSSKSSRHSHRRSSTSHDRSSDESNIDDNIMRTPASSKSKLSSLTSPTGSESSDGNSFACATPHKIKTTPQTKKKTPSSATKESQKHSKMAATALSVWEMRSRFLQEFPNDSLPSDDVLKILYSPQKLQQLERMERFQQEHPGEPVPSDDVLKRLYADTGSNLGGVSRPTTSSSTVVTTKEIPKQETPPPNPPPRNIHTNSLLQRQDSGLTFATESAWQHKMTSKKGGLFSDFGLDDFGQAIEEEEAETVGRVVIPADRLNKSMDLSLSRSCHSRTSTSQHHRSGKRNGSNPSLDILKIGSSNGANTKSSSQSLGSYNDKKTVASSLSHSMHGRNNNFRKPAFQSNNNHNNSFSKPSTNFDPFNEEEEDLNDEVNDDDEIDSNPPSKPSSLIDLLEMPSEHHPKNGNGDAKRETNAAFTIDPFNTEVGNASFGSVNSHGSRRRKGVSGSSSSSHHKRSTSGGTAKKEKNNTTRKTTKAKEAASTRKSRTVDDNGGGASKRATRTVARTKSDSLAAMKGSTHGKRKATKTAVSRSKSMDNGESGFDFDTPSFGFGGSNVFKETKTNTSKTKAQEAMDPFADAPKAVSPAKSNTADFFDVAVSAWDGDTDNNTSTPTKLAPSKKEKRPPKILLENEASAEEEDDYFPDAPPLTIGAGIKGPTRLNSVDSGGNGNGGGAAANRKNRNAAVSAMSGWMQEMPGFVVQPASPPVEQQEEEESDDDSGFDLQLPGSGGDISPLTAYTRKPVVLGRRR